MLGSDIVRLRQNRVGNVRTAESKQLISTHPLDVADSAAANHTEIGLARVGVRVCNTPMSLALARYPQVLIR